MFVEIADSCKSFKPLEVDLQHTCGESEFSQPPDERLGVARLRSCVTVHGTRTAARIVYAR